MTPIRCECGAKGDFVWFEEEFADGSANYEAVSVTELFTIDDNRIVCRLCQRASPCVGSFEGPMEMSGSAVEASRKQSPG